MRYFDRSENVVNGPERAIRNDAVLSKVRVSKPVIPRHDREKIRAIAVAIGFLGVKAAATHRAAVDRIIGAIDDTMARPGLFDFADRAFVPVIRSEVPGIVADRAAWHIPDVETLFVNLKVSGTALLAARLEARVDVTGLAAAAIS